MGLRAGPQGRTEFLLDPVSHFFLPHANEALHPAWAFSYYLFTPYQFLLVGPFFAHNVFH